MSVNLEKDLLDALEAYLKSKGHELGVGPIDSLVMPIEDNGWLEVPIILLQEAAGKQMLENKG